VEKPNRQRPSHRRPDEGLPSGDTLVSILGLWDSRSPSRVRSAANDIHLSAAIHRAQLLCDLGKGTGTRGLALPPRGHGGLRGIGRPTRPLPGGCVIAASSVTKSGSQASEMADLFGVIASVSYLATIDRAFDLGWPLVIGRLRGHGARIP
jgi:hypothetical protein